MNWGIDRVNNPFLSAILTIGWIPAGFTILAMDVQEATGMFVFAQAVAGGAVVIAPYDIWYYDERLLPSFFNNVDELVTDSDTDSLNRIASHYDQFFSEKWWILTGIWLALVTTVYVFGLDYFVSQGIDRTAEQIAYFGFILYWILVAGLRSTAVLTTLLTIRSFAKEVELDIDPLHPDGLGGLSLVGDLAIKSTLIISTGSFALPLALNIANHLQYNTVVYVGVSLFVLLVALNFVYPTYIVNRRAQDVRETMLEERRTRIRDLEKEISNPKKADTPKNFDQIQMEIRRARRDYQDFENVTLYPLSIGIIVRLFSSVLLPFVFILLEIFLPKIL
ncbi:MAG: hypothetical protein ABEJ58_10530 [Halodesulfurarchaeum sp.]